MCINESPVKKKKKKKTVGLSLNRFDSRFIQFLCFFMRLNALQSIPAKKRQKRQTAPNRNANPGR